MMDRILDGQIILNRGTDLIIYVTHQIWFDSVKVMNNVNQIISGGIL